MHLEALSAYEQFTQCAKALWESLDQLLTKVRLEKPSPGKLVSILLGTSKVEVGWIVPKDYESEQILGRCKQLYEEWNRIRVQALLAAGEISLTDSMRGGSLTDVLGLRRHPIHDLLRQLPSDQGARTVVELRGILRDELQEEGSKVSTLPSVEVAREVILVPDFQAILSWPPNQRWRISQYPTLIALESSVVYSIDKHHAESRGEAFWPAVDEWRQFIKQARSRGDTSAGVEVASGMTLREIEFQDDTARLSLNRPILHTLLRVAENARLEAMAASDWKLIRLASSLSFEYLNSLVFVVSSSVNEKLVAKELHVHTIDPKAIFGNSSQQSSQSMINGVPATAPDRAAETSHGTAAVAPSLLADDILRMVERVTSDVMKKLNTTAAEVYKDKQLMQHVVDTAYEALPFPVRLFVKRDRFHEHVVRWLGHYMEGPSIEGK